MIMDDGTAAPFFHQYFQLLANYFKNPTVSHTATKALNGKLFPLIVEAFKRHDKDGDNLLTQIEAQAFFSAFVSEQVGFFSCLSGLLVKSNFDKSEISSKLSEYKRNKAAIDARAFAVLCGTDADGYLQIHQVITALSLDTKKHHEFMRVFGLDISMTDDDETYYADSYH